MNRNYTRIAIIIVVIFVLISGGYLLAQRITRTESDYDAGISAYQRGDYRTALYDFESRANQGDKVAQFCLAYMLQHGMGVIEPKPNEALKWYEKGADQGYHPAQNNLGVLYVRQAESAAEEFQKAESELEKYQVLDSIIHVERIEEQTQPENITENLENVVQQFKVEFTENFENAQKWFQKAAKQGYAAAQFNLYILLPDNNHIEWLIKAADQNYAPAQNVLGSIYYNGVNEITKDPNKAAELYLKAADQGYADAQNNMGICYENGRGVKQNYEEAFKWYVKAAEQSYAPAQYSLGLCYHWGRGVVKNFEEAIEWYEKAAKNGNVQAQNNIGSNYVLKYQKEDEKEKKKGYLEMANRWHFLAAQQGEAMAQSNIGAKFEKGKSKRIPEDNAEAYFWYSLALMNPDTLNKAADLDRTVKVTEVRTRVAKLLSAEKTNEIDKRVKRWKPKQFKGAGTGFYIHKRYILTNAHVVTYAMNDKERQAYDEFRIPYRQVELIHWDNDVDLALLYDKGVDDKDENIDVATFRLDPVKFGEGIAIFGYPQSHILSYEGNISAGEVSGTLYIVDNPQFENRFQHNAATQRGNSGGPVFDNEGNVIGVCVSGIPDYLKIISNQPSIGISIPQYINIAQNINFAIKFNVVQDFLLDYGMRKSMLNISNLPVKQDTRAIPGRISAKARNFTVPVLSFKNKGEPPLGVETISIEELK